MRRAWSTVLALVLVGALVATAAAVGGVIPQPLSGGEGEAEVTSTTASQPPTASKSPTAAGTPAGDRANVTILAENGTTLATVSAMVAETAEERYTGLSDTESLAPGEGMLFVYEQEGNHTYVMRDMDFPLDIVFIGADGEINVIHHAPVPPEGTSESELEGYEGSGQWVLEVPRGFTTNHSISEGDEVEIER